MAKKPNRGILGQNISLKSAPCLVAQRLGHQTLDHKVQGFIPPSGKKVFFSFYELNKDILVISNHTSSKDIDFSSKILVRKILYVEGKNKERRLLSPMSSVSLL